MLRARLGFSKLPPCVGLAITNRPLSCIASTASNAETEPSPPAQPAVQGKDASATSTAVDRLRPDANAAADGFLPQRAVVVLAGCRVSPNGQVLNMRLFAPRAVSTCRL